MVQTQDNKLYLVHLTGRPLKPSMNCNLGRETAIQKATWTEDGWLRLADGGTNPMEMIEGPDVPEYPFESEPETEILIMRKLVFILIHFANP